MFKEVLLLALCANKTVRVKVYFSELSKYGQLCICEASPNCLEYFHKAVLSTFSVMQKIYVLGEN